MYSGMPFIDELLKFVTSVFVETGTYEGNTIDRVAKSKKDTQLISLELSGIYSARCKKRFEQNPMITIHKANSKYDLGKIIKDINEPITFWLDSHWSESPHVVCDPEIFCPILFELDQIKAHAIKTHTIMVNDLSLLNMKHFLITVEQICKKIYEINPDYTILYFDDEMAKNNILVAHIPKNNKTCTHTYLTVCKTNPQPPGIADFLRGTVVLFNYCEQYGYEFYLEGSHPIYSCLKPNKYIQTGKEKQEEKQQDTVIEVLPPLTFEEIDEQINILFQKNESFSILTNAMYTKTNKNLSNYGPIPSKCKEFLQSLLPVDEIENKIAEILQEYKITEKSYNVIQLRFGDKYIHEDQMCEPDLYLVVITKILNILSKYESPFMLLSDSSRIAKNLKKDIPLLHYWDSQKIHLGDLKKENLKESIFDTMTDFFILSKANKIFSFKSGFSKIVSEIYDIPYFSLQDY